LSTGFQVPSKWEETMSSELAPLIEVRAVRVLGRYTVELTFADGAVRVIDLEPFLRGEMFEAIGKNYELFLQVAVDPDAGTIVWPTGTDHAVLGIEARGTCLSAVLRSEMNEHRVYLT